MRTWGERVTGEVGSGQDEAAAGFFAPDRDVDSVRERARVTRLRLALRVIVCLASLVALDALIAPSFAPPSAYMHDYRLPVTAPTASIADYANAIDLAARAPQRRPIAVFLGASPTFGYRVTDTRNTFPAAFESASTTAGAPIQAFNLATNGQLVGDYLVLAQRFARDADVVFVQLTYHTFSGTGERPRIRYPELPALLGVPIPAAEGRLLGLPPRGADGSPAVSSALDSRLGRFWTLWRERDLIDRRLFGGSPRERIAAWFAPTHAATSASEPTITVLPDEAGSDFATFDALDPGAQMAVVAQYAEDSSFTISPGDEQVALLYELVRTLAADRKRAVFFLSPLNREIIDRYQLIDPAQYEANVSLLRGIVEERGFLFVDLNAGPDPIPAADFADISHTNDAGGALVGKLLFDRTSAYLAGVPR